MFFVIIKVAFIMDYVSNFSCEMIMIDNFIFIFLSFLQKMTNCTADPAKMTFLENIQFIMKQKFVL